MKTGICFAGGGIKGVAHIGALKAFEEENIKFDYIAGTSSGSIVACLYSIGYSADEIYEIFKKYANKIRYVDAKNIFKLIFNLIVKRKIQITGLNSGSKIEKLVNKECLKKGIKNIFHKYAQHIKKKVSISKYTGDFETKYMQEKESKNNE